VKGEDIVAPGVPESFKVLVKELQSLGLAIEVINEEERMVHAENIKEATESETEPEATQDSSYTAIEATSGEVEAENA
jgi:DNA-directed RNA polymerase subunit beta